MSLDVDLIVEEQKPHTPGIFVRENGSTREITREEWDARYPGMEPFTADFGTMSNSVYSANITHNLNEMAKEAGVYDCCWRPDEHGMETAQQIIEPLRAGLAKLKSAPVYFQRFNPSNGWGDYDGLVNFVENYLKACEEYPTARIEVSR